MRPNPTSRSIRETEQVWPLVVCALVMEAGFGLIHLARTPAEQVALVLLGYLIGGLAFIWLLWWLRDADSASTPRSAIVILLVAGIAFRLTLLPLTPATSGDVHRYLWEGLVQLHGFSPYALAPTAPQLAPLASEYESLWRSINHPDIPAIYPPVAQMLFLCNAAVFDGSLLGWKVILLVFDGLLCVCLWVLLRRESAAIVGLAGVLWCPLLLLESYEGGHLDLVGVALTVLAIVALIRGHPAVAGVALGLSINVKYLWPALLLIILARYAATHRRCLVFVAVTAGVALLSWIPYRADLGAAAETLRMFAERWTFNDLIFERVRRLPGPPWAPMAYVVGALACLAAWLALRRPRDIWIGAWLLTGGALLLGPVAYPWYFLWIVPGLALRPPMWLVVWVLSVPALHLVDWRYVSTGQWDEMRWLWLATGLLPGVLLTTAWWQHLRPTRATERC